MGEVRWHRDVRREGCAPELLAFLAELAKIGFWKIPPKGAGRTDMDQVVLYAQGRTLPGDVVTNAMTTDDSAHGFRIRNGRREFFALDVHPWDKSRDVLLFDRLDLYGQMHQLATRMGLTVGIRVGSKIDWPHVEVPGWRMYPVPHDAPEVAAVKAATGSGLLIAVAGVVAWALRG